MRAISMDKMWAGPTGRPRSDAQIMHDWVAVMDIVSSDSTLGPFPTRLVAAYGVEAKSAV